jgi:hypothetical protein
LKPPKSPSEDKELNIFNERLAQTERKHSTEREETDIQKIWKCAELRHERIMKLAEVMGYEEALSWQRDGITDYELNWELECALRVSPERRYQSLKDRWLWHEPSWWMRRFTTLPPLTDYDWQGCNNTGCIPSCRFYEATGTIEDSKLIKLEQEEHNKEEELIEAKYRMLGFNENDSDDVKRQKWAEIHELKSRIIKQKSEYLEQRQHSWQSCDDLKAIEDAAWAELYKSKNNNR